MKQKSSCRDSRRPVELLKVQDGVEGEAAQVGGVLLVPGGVVLKFLLLIQHGPPPEHVP